VSGSQYTVYKARVDCINSYYKDAELLKLKTIDLQDIINDLSVKNPNTKKPASRQLLKITKNTLNQIFRMAIENRVLDYNPANAVKIPKDAPKTNRRSLSETEREWIHTTDNKCGRRAAMIMMYAGLRRGELIPLMWNDIDLDARTINVNKSVEKVNGKFEIKYGAKTDAGVRIVDIPKKLVEFLKTESRDSIYVCVSSSKKFYTDSSWSSMWNSYLIDMNLAHGDFSEFEKQPKSKFDPAGVPFVIPKITPHWLRHTFATMLYLAGVDVLTAKEQLGHADIKTVLDIYTHLDKKHKRKAMNKLDDFLEPCKSGASQAN